jgi:hypothetical protein
MAWATAHESVSYATDRVPICQLRHRHRLGVDGVADRSMEVNGVDDWYVYVDLPEGGHQDGMVVATERERIPFGPRREPAGSGSAEGCDGFHEPVAFELAENVLDGLGRIRPGVGDLPDGRRDYSHVDPHLVQHEGIR